MILLKVQLLYFPSLLGKPSPPPPPIYVIGPSTQHSRGIIFGSPSFKIAPKYSLHTSQIPPSSVIISLESFFMKKPLTKSFVSFISCLAPSKHFFYPLRNPGFHTSHLFLLSSVVLPLSLIIYFCSINHSILYHRTLLCFECFFCHLWPVGLPRSTTTSPSLGL